MFSESWSEIAASLSYICFMTCVAYYFVNHTFFFMVFGSVVWFAWGIVILLQLWILYLCLCFLTNWWFFLFWGYGMWIWSRSCVFSHWVVCGWLFAVSVGWVFWVGVLGNYFFSYELYGFPLFLFFVLI